MDAAYAEIKSRKEDIPLLVDLQNMYYGSREFQVLDPDGNITCIINYEKDLHARKVAACENGLYAEEFRAVFYVKNLAACYRFYTEVLQMASVYQWEEHLGDRGYKYQLCKGSTSYVETLFREPKTPLRHGIAEIYTQDINACFARIAERGGEFVSRGVQADGGAPFFELQDPDGNLIRVKELQ